MTLAKCYSSWRQQGGNIMALTLPLPRVLAGWRRFIPAHSTRLARSPHLSRSARFVLAGTLSTLIVLGLSGSPAASAQAPKPSTTGWRHAVIEEIYPRSFQDSNGDGIGDLNGITSRMPYLHDLGIDAVWIAPMYPSPQIDFGYDISNYEAVDPHD